MTDDPPRTLHGYYSAATGAHRPTRRRLSRWESLVRYWLRLWQR